MGGIEKYPCFGDGAVGRVECQDAIVVVLDPLRWEDGGWGEDKCNREMDELDLD